MEVDLKRLALELDGIDSLMLDSEYSFKHLLKAAHPFNKKTAKNLLHYLVLRSLDIRELQDRLHTGGLSSMASSESHIRGQLVAITQRLDEKKLTPKGVFNYKTGKKSLADRSSGLFGSKKTDTIPYIMITLDRNAAREYAKVKNLIQSGMNIARINCAHDDENIWLQMILHIKRAVKATGLSCKIYMDLAGPKIRTILKNKSHLKVFEGKSFYMTDAQHLKDDPKLLGCSVAGISDQIHKGEKVLFDDGLIEAIVQNIEGAIIKLKVIRISSKKPFVKNEKGINFPESHLTIPAISEYDLQCLPFILKHADLVGYSFVKNEKDVLQLQEMIDNHKNLSLILKIETLEAVNNLPDLLFAGMRNKNFGVMIARGDLAIEIGFERMSEIQEEILWICEAAHVPVIWATQVLETLNKSGLATRSEITDAAHAAMADCVMINKGNHILQTIETLQDILQRSGGHHVKKRFTFRPLTIASNFVSSKTSFSNLQNPSLPLFF